MVFKNEEEESAIVQGLQLAKGNYAFVRDTSGDVNTQCQMEKKIKVIDKFLTWTAIDTEHIKELEIVNEVIEVMSDRLSDDLYERYQKDNGKFPDEEQVVKSWEKDLQEFRKLCHNLGYTTGEIKTREITIVRKGLEYLQAMMKRDKK